MFVLLFARWVDWRLLLAQANFGHQFPTRKSRRNWTKLGRGCTNLVGHTPGTWLWRHTPPPQPHEIIGPEVCIQKGLAPHVRGEDFQSATVEVVICRAGSKHFLLPWDCLAPEEKEDWPLGYGQRGQVVQRGSN